MTRRLLFYALALAVMLGAATGRSAPVRAGSAPDDPPASDPVSVQAPVSVQGPAAGLPFSPPTASSGLPSVPPRQAAPPPIDTTAVIRPSTAIAPFATAQCRDAWFSYSQSVAETCAGHGGVLTWITQPGDADALAAQRLHDAAIGSLGWPTTFTLPAESIPTCVAFDGGACAVRCNDGQWDSKANDPNACSGHRGIAAPEPS